MGGTMGAQLNPNPFATLPAHAQPQDGQSRGTAVGNIFMAKTMTTAATGKRSSPIQSRDASPTTSRNDLDIHKGKTSMDSLGAKGLFSDSLAYDFRPSMVKTNKEGGAVGPTVRQKIVVARLLLNAPKTVSEVPDQMKQAQCAICGALWRLR